jgi:hypothetical protein
MSTGWAAITGAVGLGAGAGATGSVAGGTGVFSAASQAAALSGAATTGGTVLGAASQAAALAGTAGGAAAAGATAAAAPLAGSIFGGAANAAAASTLAASTSATTATLGSRFMGSLMGNDVKGAFMRSAIVGGISSYGKKKQWDEEQKRKNNATVYGGKAFGGSADLPEGFIRKPILPGQESSPEDSTARQLAVDVPDVGAKAQTLDPRASFRNSPFSSDKQRGSGATDISTLGGVQGGALGGSDRVGLLA